MGHNSFVYLDDSFGSQPERTSAVAAAFIQQEDLDSSGLLVNEEKSHWVQMQVGEWLGFVINTTTKRRSVSLAAFEFCHSKQVIFLS